MQFNTAQRELTLKIVYYGPALSGKTSNLQSLYALLSPDTRGELTALDTRGDRTLFFDLLPLNYTTQSGIKIKIKLFTVPGQVMHEATRRIVLTGADAVIFVADSQRSATPDNNKSFKNLLQNLTANGLDVERIPIVIQFNKRDLPDVTTDEELAQLAARGREPIYRAVALRGEGVVETLYGVMHLLWQSLEAHDFGKKLGISHREFMSGVWQALGPPAAGAGLPEVAS